MSLSMFLDFILAMSRSGAPLLIAGLAALLCERSGVVMLALEGFMLFGAFCAAAVALYSGSVYGLLLAAAFGSLMGLSYAFLVVRLRVDQIVSGIVVNMIAWGGIPIACKAIFGSSAGTPTIAVHHRLPSFVPIFIAILCLMLVWFVLRKTRVGLWITFAGEKPDALTSVGVSAQTVRWGSICVSGALAAIAGGCLSVSLSSSYSRNMTAGRGFIALAAVILGKWKPVPVLLSCLLFGFFDVLQMKLQGIELPLLGVVPNQLIQMIPYASTLLILAGIVGAHHAPSRLGKPL